MRPITHPRPLPGRAGGSSAQRLLPRIDRDRARQAVVLQQPRQPLARSGRIAGEDRLAAVLAQCAQVLDHRLVDVDTTCTLGGEIARAVDGEIEHRRAFGFVERRRDVRLRGGQCVRPFLRAEIQRLGGKGPVAAGLRRLGAFAVLEIIGDRLQSAFRRLRDARLAHDDRIVAEMVEQRRQLFLEQRQPMLHPRLPPPVGHRLIDRIARRGRAEGLAVAAAEPLDRLRIEQRLGRGKQSEAVDPPGGPLVLRIEGPHALDLVAEEIEPQRLFLARRIQIDQPAAHRIFALVVDGIGADIAVGLEQRRQIVTPDPLAGGQSRDELAQAKRGQHALRRGVDRGENELRTPGLGLQPVERADPLRHDTQRRRGTVVGQAVPGGDLHDLQIGREERCGRRDRAHRGIVGGDEHHAGRSRAREIGEQRGEEAGRNAREGQRGFGREDGLQVGHSLLAPLPFKGGAGGWVDDCEAFERGDPPPTPPFQGGEITPPRSRNRSPASRASSARSSGRDTGSIRSPSP